VSVGSGLPPLYGRLLASWGPARREGAPDGDTASSIACDASAVPRVAHLINSLADDINEITNETTMFHHRDSARVKRTIFKKEHRL